MRLFTAIPLPGRVKRQLQALQQPIDGLRWNKSAQRHLTLVFMGEVEPALARAIEKQFSGIECPAFDLQIRDFGFFPGKHKPRVLWAGVAPGKELMHLHQAIEKRCLAAGLQVEKRRYIPHITLAKIKGPSREELLSWVNRNKPFKIENIPVKRFVLYNSIMQKGAAVHKPLATFELKEA